MIRQDFFILRKILDRPNSTAGLVDVKEDVRKNYCLEQEEQKEQKEDESSSPQTKSTDGKITSSGASAVGPHR